MAKSCDLRIACCFVMLLLAAAAAAAAATAAHTRPRCCCPRVQWPLRRCFPRRAGASGAPRWVTSWCWICTSCTSSTRSDDRLVSFMQRIASQSKAHAQSRWTFLSLPASALLKASTMSLSALHASSLTCSLALGADPVVASTLILLLSTV
jgi:hypothetical protein